MCPQTLPAAAKLRFALGLCHLNLVLKISIFFHVLGGGDEGEKRKSPLTHGVQKPQVAATLWRARRSRKRSRRGYSQNALLYQRVISREAPASAVRAYPLSPARGRSAEFPLRPSDPAGGKCFEPSPPAGKKKELDEIRYIFFRLATTLNCPFRLTVTKNLYSEKSVHPFVPNFIKFSCNVCERYRNGWLVRCCYYRQVQRKSQILPTLRIA